MNLSLADLSGVGPAVEGSVIVEEETSFTLEGEDLESAEANREKLIDDGLIGPSEDDLFPSSKKNRFPTVLEDVEKELERVISLSAVELFPSCPPFPPECRKMRASGEKPGCDLEGV